MNRPLLSRRLRVYIYGRIGLSADARVFYGRWIDAIEKNDYGLQRDRQKPDI